jgi:peptide/nickel transport system substrate-binding protein
MTWSRSRFLLAGVLASFALAVSACGDDEKDTATTPKGTPAETQEGKKGGTLRIQAASDVDFLDPGRTYYSLAFVIEYAISTPLYYFNPGSQNEVPYLADGDPEVSDDQKTITVKIKKGWKFGPPVDREITTKDIKYAFERFFSANVGGQYPGYFQAIVGAPQKPTKGVKPISGIETPDDQTLVIRLSKPVAAAMVPALVMPITIPVPEEYAKEFDAKSPSTYNTHVVSTGPYMVSNDSSGKLTGYKAGKSIELVRNPNWDGEAVGDPRPAYVNRVQIRTNASDANVSGRQILDSQNLISIEDPPANILREVITRIKDQYETASAGAFRYFPMNTTVKPFDDLNVRKAVMAGFDREAARLARGGKYVGPIATHWLPPDFPGHDESGGLEGFGFDFFSDKNTKGDLAVAAKYFKAAGFKSGKYEGDETILMVGSNADPGKAQSEVAKAQLEKLGFKVRLRLVPQDSVYTEWCQVPSKNVGMCGGAAWSKDFNDPQSMIEPLFKGSLINPKSGNINYSELNDPEIDKLMDDAALAAGDDRIKQWVEVNKKIVESAAAVPFVWDAHTVLRSKNVVGQIAPYLGLWDLSFMSLK